MRLRRERRAATAGSGSEWILEYETAIKQPVIEVEFGAAHEELTLLVNDHVHAVHLKRKVKLGWTILVEIEHSERPLDELVPF